MRATQMARRCVVTTTVIIAVLVASTVFVSGDDGISSNRGYARTTTADISDRAVLDRVDNRVLQTSNNECFVATAEFYTNNPQLEEATQALANEAVQTFDDQGCAAATGGDNTGKTICNYNYGDLTTFTSLETACTDAGGQYFSAGQGTLVCDFAAVQQTFAIQLDNIPACLAPGDVCTSEDVGQAYNDIVGVVSNVFTNLGMKCNSTITANADSNTDADGGTSDTIATTDPASSSSKGTIAPADAPAGDSADGGSDGESSSASKHQTFLERSIKLLVSSLFALSVLF